MALEKPYTVSPPKQTQLDYDGSESVDKPSASRRPSFFRDVRSVAIFIFP